VTERDGAQIKTAKAFLAKTATGKRDHSDKEIRCDRTARNRDFFMGSRMQTRFPF
jgi:hypothetical protein